MKVLQMNGQDIFNVPIINKSKLAKLINVNYNTLYTANMRGYKFNESVSILIEQVFFPYKILMNKIDTLSLKRLSKILSLRAACNEANISYPKIWKKILNKQELTITESDAIKSVLNKYFGDLQ